METTNDYSYEDPRASLKELWKHPILVIFWANFTRSIKGCLCMHSRVYVCSHKSCAATASPCLFAPWEDTYHSPVSHKSRFLLIGQCTCFPANTRVTSVWYHFRRSPSMYSNPPRAAIDLNYFATYIMVKIWTKAGLYSVKRFDKPKNSFQHTIAAVGLTSVTAPITL